MLARVLLMTPAAAQDLALEFDGNDDYAGADNWVASSTHTLSLWMFPHAHYDANSVDTVLGWDDGAGTELRLYRRADHANQDFDNVVGLTWDHGAATATSYRHLFKSAANWQQNTWMHLLITLSGDAAAIYINGANKPWNFTSTDGPPPTGSLSLKVGGKGVSGFDGLLDDVRVYDRLLDSTEIAVLHANRGQDVLPGGRVLWLKFDEGVPDQVASGEHSIIDSSGQGHHCTPYGAPVYRATT